LPAQRIVATDANVLINLIHVDALAMVASLPDYEFVVVDEVVGELPIHSRPLLSRQHLRKIILRETVSRIWMP
jgi:hypothetical protein